MFQGERAGGAIQRACVCPWRVRGGSVPRWMAHAPRSYSRVAVKTTWTMTYIIQYTPLTDEDSFKKSAMETRKHYSD